MLGTCVRKSLWAFVDNTPISLQSEAQDNSASSSEEASDPRSPTFRQMEVNPPCSGIPRPNRSSNHDGSQVERHGWGMFASAYPLTVRGGPMGSANRMRQGKASQPSIPSRVENLAACILYFRTDPADRYALYQPTASCLPSPAKPELLQYEAGRLDMTLLPLGRVLFAQLVEEFQIAAVVNLAQNIRWPLTNGKRSIIWRKPPATEDLRRF
uniref:Uncharacterized protein n=1 Tax=Coccidioides posadasii RMSCC 3488 TaxID=454284 RepID=A0A0J6IKZ1_COCPO|nr:hypothetical protein CPAG_08906 [Coccidioides posadasii RMSCC 3488]